MADRYWHGSTIVVCAGGLLLVVGPFFPWLTIGGGFLETSRNGMDAGGGLWFLIVGVLVLVLAWTRGSFAVPEGQYRWGPAIPAVVGLGLWRINYTDMLDLIAGAPAAAAPFMSVGVGLWMVGIGAIAAIVGAVIPVER